MERKIMQHNLLILRISNIFSFEDSKDIRERKINIKKDSL